MPNTPRGYPYPIDTTPAEGWLHIESLARAIDTDMAARAAKEAGAPFGIISYTPGNANNNTRLVAQSGVTLARGITHDGAGRLTLPSTGIYLAMAGVLNSTPSIVWMKITAKTDDGSTAVAGSIGPGTTAGSSSSLAAPLIVSAAPRSFGLWVECSATVATFQAVLAIVRLGDL